MKNNRQHLILAALTLGALDDLRSETVINSNHPKEIFGVKNPKQFIQPCRDVNREYVWRNNDVHYPALFRGGEDTIVIRPSEKHSRLYILNDDRIVSETVFFGTGFSILMRSSETLEFTFTKGDFDVHAKIEKVSSPFKRFVCSIIDVKK